MRTRMNGTRVERGFSLIEAMISMAILTVGILGVAKLQGLAAGQNGYARRAQQAGVIARDFVENVARWEYDDPRLDSHGCGTDLTTNFPVTEAMLGRNLAPAFALDYTATPSTVSTATSEGVRAGGLTYSSTIYPGRASTLVATASAGERYQLLWSVREVNPTNFADTTDCLAKQVSVVVRYLAAGGDYRSFVTSTVKYDRTQIGRASRTSSGTGILEMF